MLKIIYQIVSKLNTWHVFLSCRTVGGIISVIWPLLFDRMGLVDPRRSRTVLDYRLSSFTAVEHNLQKFNVCFVIKKMVRRRLWLSLKILNDVLICGLLPASVCVCVRGLSTLRCKAAMERVGFAVADDDRCLAVWHRINNNNGQIYLQRKKLEVSLRHFPHLTNSCTRVWC